MAEDTPIVLDIEASGFGRGSYPIEVGVALPAERTFCTLIRPEADWTHWDPGAEAVHHIRRELLFSHGRAAAEVADALNKMLRDARVYSDAWGQDSSWLALLFEVAERPQRFRLQPLRGLLSESQAARWHAVRARVEAEVAIKRHRASADALVIQRTLLATLAAGT